MGVSDIVEALRCCWLLFRSAPAKVVGASAQVKMEEDLNSLAAFAWDALASELYLSPAALTCWYY